jgi:predicted nucleic acid-binding protein
MKYVLDSSAFLKWVLVEEFTSEARTIRDDFDDGIHELIAPDILPVEAAHAITKAQRQNRITASEGTSLLAALLDNLPFLNGSISLLPRAYDISAANRISVYDSLYVALAEREQCSVITTDQRLINSLPGYPVLHLSAVS